MGRRAGARDKCANQIGKAAPEVGLEPTTKRLTAARSIVKIQGGSQIEASYQSRRVTISQNVLSANGYSECNYNSNKELGWADDTMYVLIA